MPAGIQCFDIVGNTTKIYLNFFNIAPFWDCVYRENLCAGKCIIGNSDHTSSKCGIIAYFTRLLIRILILMRIVYSSFHDVIEQCKYYLVFTHDVKLYHYLKICTKNSHLQISTIQVLPLWTEMYSFIFIFILFFWGGGVSNWYSQLIHHLQLPSF